MANWQAFSDLWNQGSFVSQVPAPNADPAGEPTVCVQFGAAWLPYVLGSLFQLTQPSAWDPASAGFADVLTQAQALMAIFSEGGECLTMLQFRCDPDTGAPQYSIDGGVTWTDLPDCFVGPPGPEGPAGPTGPTGPTGPPYVGAGTAPPNPQGVSTDQQACNIAGYLADMIIKASMQSAVDSVNDGKTIADAVAGIVSLIPGVDITIGLIIDGGAFLVNAVAAITTAPYEAALADDTLWSQVTCAIFDAIEADGYVTDANYPDILTNLAAVPYSNADVVSTIHDYVEKVGATSLEYQQNQGSLYVADCTDCLPWCFEWDFTSGGADIWSAYGPYTTFVPGTGWVGSYNPAGSPLNTDTSIQAAFSAVEIESMEVTYLQLSSSISSNTELLAELSGSVVAELPLDNPGSGTPYVTTLDIGADVDSLYAIMRIAGNVTPVVIQKVVCRGHGTNPFGMTNCT